MTWGLCLHCGEVKFGAICPCPKCNQNSTGNMQLDIAFSDHHLSKDSLKNLGTVVSSIHEVSDDNQLCFWTFIHYIDTHHPSILRVNLDEELRVRTEELLTLIVIPEFEIEESPIAKMRDELEQE